MAHNSIEVQKAIEALTLEEKGLLLAYNTSIKLPSLRKVLKYETDESLVEAASAFRKQLGVRLGISHGNVLNNLERCRDTLEKAYAELVEPLEREKRSKKITRVAQDTCVEEDEAEFILAYLTPNSGYRKCTLAALQTINRLAAGWQIRVEDAITVLREYV